VNLLVTKIGIKNNELILKLFSYVLCLRFVDMLGAFTLIVPVFALCQHEKIHQKDGIENQT